MFKPKISSRVSLIKAFCKQCIIFGYKIYVGLHINLLCAFQEGKLGNDWEGTWEQWLKKGHIDIGTAIGIP